MSCQFLYLWCFCRVVHTLSHNFRNATRLERVRLQLPIEPHSTLVKILYAGVNASDVGPCICIFNCFSFYSPIAKPPDDVNDMFQVNFSSGRYFSGNAKEAVAHLPFDAGFEVTNAFHISMLSVEWCFI